RNDEEYIGVTVHLMSGQIDKGAILAQEKIRIHELDTVDSLYQKCFTISAAVCLEALHLLADPKDQPPSHEVLTEASYFSFPTKEQWKEFRAKKRKFI